MTDTPPEPDHTDEQLPAWATPLTIETVMDGLVAAFADHMPYAKGYSLVAVLDAAGLVIAPDPEVRIEHYRDTAGDYRWRALDTHNGLVVADSSEGYRTRAHAHHMANRLFPTAHATEV